MHSKLLLSAVIALTLAACGGKSAEWVKAGATPEDIRADQASCRATAERATARDENVTRDIRSSVPGGREDLRAVVEDTRDLGTARSYERLFRQCMRAQGYTQPET